VEEGIPSQIINEIWLVVWPALLCVHEDDGDDGDDGDEVEMTSEYYLPHAGGGGMTWLRAGGGCLRG
jgi:hypothetical protein